MQGLLNNIPLIDNICRPYEGYEWLMNIDERRAKPLTEPMVNQFYRRSLLCHRLAYLVRT
jgi:hypothetical protein